MTSTVPLIQFTPTGIVLPSEESILSAVQSDMNTAFGGNLNPALTTPMGQLASAQSEIIAASNTTFAEFVNGVNPPYSEGFMQDAIGNIYFLKRNPAISTTVTCVVTGIGGTIIPNGAIAFDTNQNKYSCVSSVTIPSSGSTNAVFQNIVPGAIGCPANTLITIGQTISGWDAITNPSDGVIGSEIESTQEFEFRRQQTVAANSVGGVLAVLGSVFKVPNVVDCYVVDNPLGQVLNYGETNYPLEPNSIYIAVTGGDSLDIAKAILNKKSPGCNYNANAGVGATVVTVPVEITEGYPIPYPVYNVTYIIPKPTPIYFKISIKNNINLPSDIGELISTSIINTFNGYNGSQKARIGSLIAVSYYYCDISSISKFLIINDFTVGFSSNPTESSVTLGIDQQPTTQNSYIEVVVEP